MDRFHKRLNAPGVIDPVWHRRNHAGYELLGYINHLIALYAAENYNAMPLFISRAHAFLEGPHASQIRADYRELVREYLLAATSFLEDRTDVTDASKEFIPESLRGASKGQ